MTNDGTDGMELADEVSAGENYEYKPQPRDIRSGALHLAVAMLKGQATAANTAIKVAEAFADYIENGVAKSTEG